MPVREISNDSLNGELTAAGDKLVMVDFFATWFVFTLWRARNNFYSFVSGAALAKPSLRTSNT